MEESNRPDILIVDDEPDNLDLLERALRSEFTVHRATGGEDALRLLPNIPGLCVIITDQRMPGLTGTEMLRKARVHRPEAVRIILTGYSAPADLIAAINDSNVYRYITKPFQMDELRQVLRRALRVCRAGGGYMVDEVTGLANRGLLRRQLVREVARTGRQSSPLVIVKIQVQGFDKCVEVLGATETDALLAGLAECLEARVRATDLLGCYDQGLFLVLMPACDQPQATMARLESIANACPALLKAGQQVAGLTIALQHVAVQPEWSVTDVCRELAIPDCALSSRWKLYSPGSRRYDPTMTSGVKSRQPLGVAAFPEGDEFDLDALPIEAESSQTNTSDLRPSLRQDLVVAERDSETVLVRTPQSTTAFPVYRLEWRAAQLMDGRRSLAEIARDLTGAGVSATPDLVRSFVRELRGYGFLEKEARTLRELAPQSAAPGAKLDVSEEERQLIQAAIGKQTRGDLKAAGDYLTAVLEINPRNPTARQMLEALQTSKPLADAGWARETTNGGASAGPPPGGPRPTLDVINTAPIVVVPAAESASAPPVAERSRPRLSLVHLVLAGIVGCGVTLGIVLLATGQKVAIVETGSGAATPPMSPVPTPPVRPAAVPEFVFRAMLEPWQRVTVSAPSAAVVTELLVADHATLTEGKPVVRLLDGRNNRKVMQVAQEIARLRAKKGRDKVMVYFLRQAEQRFERLSRGKETTAATASTAGVVGLAVQPGQVVAEGEALFHIDDTSKLAAPIRADALPFPVERASCLLSGATKGQACRIEPLPGGGARVVVDNAAQQLGQGLPADIVILCKDCGGR